MDHDDEIAEEEYSPDIHAVLHGVGCFLMIVYLLVASALKFALGDVSDYEAPILIFAIIFWVLPALYMAIHLIAKGSRGLKIAIALAFLCFFGIIVTMAILIEMGSKS